MAGEMLHRIGCVAMMLIALAGCATGSGDRGTPTTAAISVEGQVVDVSPSARIIVLEEAVDGYSIIALREECELFSADGAQVELRDIKPGMAVAAVGQGGESGALLADLVVVP